MSSFTGPINVALLKPTDHGRATWMLLTPIDYHVGSEDSSEVIRLGIGARTDGASVPWLLSWLVPVIEERTFRPCALHDDLLKHRRDYSRKQIDRIFKEALKVMSVPGWKTQAMYLAVRFNAWYTGDK